MINIFDKPYGGSAVVKELIRSINKITLVKDTPIKFIEIYLSGLLMENPFLTTDGLITLQIASKRTLNLSTSILEGLIEQVSTHGYTRFPPDKKDKEVLEQLYPIIRMGNHSD